MICTGVSVSSFVTKQCCAFFSQVFENVTFAGVPLCHVSEWFQVFLTFILSQPQESHPQVSYILHVMVDPGGGY